MASLILVLNHVFLPLTIIIAVTSILGLLGNAMAFYVFTFRFPSTGFNLLMASLAVYDMMACVIHMPLDIATFFDIGHLRPFICKVTCFQLAFTATGVALILMAVAFVRFSGIHKPLAGSFSTKSAVCVIVVSVLFACGLSLPITFLFGDGELVTDANITTRICAVEPRFMSTIGPITYYFILASLYVITFVCHTCLYVKSVLTIWDRRRTFVALKGNKNVVMMTPGARRNMNRFKPTTGASPSSSPAPSTRVSLSSSPPPLSLSPPSSSTSPDPTTESVLNSGTRFDPVPARRTMTQGCNSYLQTNENVVVDETEIEMRPGTGNTTEKQITLNTRHNNLGEGSNPRPKPLPRVKQCTNTSPTPLPRSKHSTPNAAESADTPDCSNKINQNSYRILAVVVAISMTYFLSYAPHFWVMFYLFTHDEAVFTSSCQSLVFELLMRSFFLNNILDPVIYGLLSTDFRREVKEVLCCFTRIKS